MARITVEDCVDHADNRFALVILAAKRARQLNKNARPVIEGSKNKPAVMALRECPFCDKPGMRAATRCGHCWRALPPEDGMGARASGEDTSR